MKCKTTPEGSRPKFILLQIKMASIGFTLALPTDELKSNPPPPIDVQTNRRGTLKNRIIKRLAQGGLALGLCISTLVTFALPASAALYVTGPNNGSAQLTANFNGGTSCVKDTSHYSYVTLRAYNSSNQLLWVIQDNTNNGVAVCAYTQGGVHHLTAWLSATYGFVPQYTKSWRANRPSSSWIYTGCTGC